MAAVAQLKATGPKDLYEIGEIPPLGHVPERMYAWASGASGTARPSNPCRSKCCPLGRSATTTCSSS
jgi:hypothetical protein